MDIGSVTGGMAKSIGGVIGSIGQAIPYVFALAAMGGIGFWIWWEMQFNKRVNIYKMVGTSFRLISDKARLTKDANRVGFWHLRNIGVKVDIPPSECLIYSKKGEVAEGYMNSTGDIIWIKHAFTPDLILKKLEKIKEAKARGETVDNLDAHDAAVAEFVKSMRPVTTTQRASYAYQDDQARSYKKEDWIKANMPIIIGGIFIVLTLAIFMMFYGKVIEPTTAAQAVVVEYEQIRLDELRVIQDMNARVQRIEGALNVTNEATPLT